MSLPDTARAATVYDANELERIEGFVDLAGGLEAAPDFNTADESFQTVAGDVNLGAAVGDNTDTHFLAGGMFSVIGNAIATTKNYLAGVIGSFNVTGTNATTYPTAGVLGLIGDGVTDVDGAIVAVLDGDSAQTNGRAMYGVMCNNSTAASGTDFGLDLQSAAHDGFIAVDAAFYKKAPLRLVRDVVVLAGDAAPTDTVTGAGVAGPGSLYVRTHDTNGQAYVNTNTKASPTWAALS